MGSREEMLARLEDGLPYRTYLRRLARNILRNNDEVEDVLQEVHVAAWLKVQHDLGEPVDDLKRWLTSTTRNRALDVKRKQKKNEQMLRLVAQGG